MTAPAPRAEPDVLANFIGGKFVAPASGDYIDDIGPASGEVIARIPDSDARDVDRAVAAARAHRLQQQFRRVPSA